MKLLLAGCLIGVSLAGCASGRWAHTPSIATLPDEWSERRAALQAHDRFELEGRVAVVSADDGLVAGLVWRQRAARSEVDLQGPGGIGTRRWRFDGNAAAGASPPADWRALEETLGVALPLASVRYWLLGVPNPDLPAEERLLAGGERLASLSQAGWEVNFLDYSPIGPSSVSMPSRLEIQRDPWRIRLVIRDWRELR